MSAASERVQREWSRRVEAEYASAAITTHLAWWLIQIGASADLIEAGLDVTRDELAHARLSHRVCIDAGMTTTLHPIPRERLALPTAGGDLLGDVVRGCVRSFCINETLAVPLFRAMRDDAEIPVACEALDRILVDEVRHRDFGWRLLEWLVDQHGDDVRTTAGVEARRELERREALCASMSTGASAIPLQPTEAAWGLIEGPNYGPIFARCRQRDLEPRFNRLGIPLTPP
jgi:hypothetical protein